MDNYKVNKDIKKEDFIRKGFTYCNCNILHRKTFLYKNFIILTVTIDFTEEDIGLYTDISYSNGNSYPVHNEYGKSKVRECVSNNYVKEMNRLVKQNLLRKMR